MSDTVLSPIVVFLDSSTLRSINPRSALVTEFLRLSKEETISIRIHEIVWKEVTTGLWEEARPLIDKALKLRKHVSWIADEQKRNSFLQAIEALSEIGDLAGSEMIDSGFKDLVENGNIYIVPLALEQTEDVFRSYFQGSAPFKSAKSRNDIPDAFIFSVIKEAASNHDIAVHAITSDNELREACQDLGSVSVHGNIVDFFGSKEVEERLKAKDQEISVNSWRHRFHSMLANNSNFFWDRLGKEVGKWIRTNANLQFENIPIRLSYLGSFSKQELIEERVAVLSPLTAVIGVSMATTRSAFIADSTYFDQTQRFHVGANGIYSMLSLRPGEVELGIPIELSADVTVKVIPYPGDRRPYRLEVNSVTIKNLDLQSY